MNPTAVKENQKNNQLLFVKNRLTADASGALPTRLEILKAGKWVNSWKGDLEITVPDLLEMKLNFARGIGLPGGGSEGAPIDFSHEEWNKAAAWMKALEVDEVAGILYASEIEWTTSGREAIEGGDFKFFSPSVYPACLGTWSDPEDPTHTAQNVLMGGGLTNIPFFKGLTGLKASQTSQDDGRENVIYLAKGEEMDLAALRTKKKEELSTEESAFLVEHKTELTAEEQLATGVVETPAPATPEVPNPATPPADPTPVDSEAQALQASLKAGTHIVIKKEDFTNLQASAQASASKLAEMEKEKITARVDAAVASGRIKSDQHDKWVGRIVADSTILEDLEALPENKILATEIGSSAAAGSAKVQLESKIQAAREANPQLSYGDATSQVRKDNPALAQEYDKEIKG